MNCMLAPRSCRRLVWKGSWPNSVPCPRQNCRREIPVRGTQYFLDESDLRPGGKYDDLQPLPALGDPRRPRVAALQRLVDVADMNVHLEA